MATSSSSFKTTGFDARIWELYLFAAFTELGYEISRIHAIPDFCCESPFGAFNVEAVTVNPTRDKLGQVVSPPAVDTEEQANAYLKNYMPMKFAGSLTGKSNKEYWEKEHVAELPPCLKRALDEPGSERCRAASQTTTSPRPRILGELVRGHLSLSQPSGPQAP